jgi:hypothetical protein
MASAASEKKKVQVQEPDKTNPHVVAAFVLQGVLKRARLAKQSPSK